MKKAWKKIKLFFYQLTISPWATVLGILAMITASRALFDASLFPYEQTLGPLVNWWLVAYFLGGFFLCVGIGSARRNLEAAGCALFTAGSLLAAFVYGQHLGWFAPISWVTVFTQVIFAGGAATRLYQLLYSKRQIITVVVKKQPKNEE